VLAAVLPAEASVSVAAVSAVVFAESLVCSVLVLLHAAQVNTKSSARSMETNLFIGNSPFLI